VAAALGAAAAVLSAGADKTRTNLLNASARFKIATAARPAGFRPFPHSARSRLLPAAPSVACRARPHLQRAEPCSSVRRRRSTAVGWKQRSRSGGWHALALANAGRDGHHFFFFLPPISLAAACMAFFSSACFLRKATSSCTVDSAADSKHASGRDAGAARGRKMHPATHPPTPKQGIPRRSAAGGTLEPRRLHGDIARRRCGEQRLALSVLAVCCSPSPAA
jgi:hypothetical protein